MVGQGQIRPVMDKVEAPQAYIKLRTKKQVGSFAGLANYYRKFLPNFSDMVAPFLYLREEVRGQELTWTECA